MAGGAAWSVTVITKSFSIPSSYANVWVLACATEGDPSSDGGSIRLCGG